MHYGGRHVTDNEIRRAAKKHGVPFTLFRALVEQESGRDVKAKSSVGARGPAQVMPSTGPPTLEFGAKYLSQQKKAFGSWRLALAAYNAGPGAVQSGDWTSYGETTKYVRNILAKAGALTSPNDVKTSVSPSGGMGGVKMIKGVPQIDPLSASASSGLAALAQGGYNPSQQLGELQQLEAQAAATPEVMPEGDHESTSPSRPSARPAGDFDWREWVVVPQARGGPSPPHGEPILRFVGQIGQMAGRKLTPWDNTTHSLTTVNGTPSAHGHGNAADIPATGAELRELGYLALRAAGMSEKRARAAQRRGGLYNVGGYQIIFATKVGGNHYDHLHVGIRG